MIDKNQAIAQEALNNLKWALHDLQTAAAACKHIRLNIKDLETAFRIITDKRTEILKMLEVDEEVKSNEKTN